MSGAIGLVGVVVPARDEEALVGRCLDAVLVAAAAVAPVPVWPLVVVDRCTDGTEAVARALGVDAVASRASGVGGARRTGVALVATRAAALGVPDDRVWVATTDADSVVPSHWLETHLAIAGAGGRLVVGRVRPDPADLSAELLAAWRARHTSTSVVEHVHGANLAVRLDAYRAVGGFVDAPVHEDRMLVEALLGAGVVAERGPEVLTSARRVGRVPGGFSGYLGDLARAVGLPGHTQG